MTSGHREASMITSIVRADGAGLDVERRGDGPAGLRDVFGWL
jgi:hypothetical protein